MRLPAILAEAGSLAATAASRAVAIVQRGLAALVRGVGRWLGRAALLVMLVGLPVVVVAALLASPELQRSATIASAAISLALAIALCEAGVLVIYLAVRGFSWMLRSTVLFGRARSATRLVALLIVVPFFSSLPAACARAAATAVVGLTLEIPLTVVQGGVGKDLSDPDGALDERALAVMVISPLWVALGELAALGSRLAREISLATLLVALALWVLAAHVIEELRDAKAAHRLREFVAARPSLSGPNLGFLVILASGLFLSLAAITSLPRLREKYAPNSDVSPEALQRTLEKLPMTQEQVGRYLQVETPKAAPSPGSSSLSTTSGTSDSTGGSDVSRPPRASEGAPSLGRKAADEKTGSEPPRDGGSEEAVRQTQLDWRGYLAATIADRWKHFDARLAGLGHQRTTLAAGILNAQAQALASAVSQFHVENLDRRGSREEAEHFLRTRAWFAAQVRIHEASLISCSKGIRDVEAAAVEMNDDRKRALSMLQKTEDSGLTELGALPTPPYELLFRADESCSMPQLEPLPRKPDLGESLGPLRFVAAWLLNAGSVPLAAVIGMIGFGLLGAVISTFVRERLAGEAQRSTPPHVLVSDLVGVVLRGLSAAVVVFLGVQGGLAVFAGGQADPNPYVLLLTCLVAAVFSEKVWARAYDYLADKLAGKPDALGGSPPDAAGTAAGPLAGSKGTKGGGPMASSQPEQSE